MCRKSNWVRKLSAGALTVVLVGTGIPFSATTVEAALPVVQDVAQETTQEAVQEVEQEATEETVQDVEQEATEETEQEEVSVETKQVNADSGNYELMSDVQGSSILHCWNWSYKTIEEHMELIAESGYTAIQTSPATQPKDYTYQGTVASEMGYPKLHGKGNWWKVYQPVTFSVCDNGQTWFGTKAELESMCATAEKYGIKVIVDIVANHLGNITGWQNSLSDVSPQVGEYWNPEMLTDESFWHINDHKVHNSDGRLHFTQGCMGMPDLNTANKTVQKYVYEYLDELIDCGVDGFRFDAAKHIETPDDDPSYASDFWPTVLGEAESHYKSKTGGDLYVYGEILNTVGLNFSIDSYTKYMSVTDNSAGNHLLDAFRNNNCGNTLGLNYAADKTVLWAESHDTYMNESSSLASDKSIVRTWAMVANKKDAAALFFVRPYYSKDVLKDDADNVERGDLGNNVAPAIMGECETYVWASKEVAAINHFNNRMAGYADNTGADGKVAYCQRGNGIILVNFDGAGSVSIGSHGLTDGSYTDEVSGNTFTVSGGTINGNITSEYGVAVLYNNVKSNPSDVYPVHISSSIDDGSNYYLDTIGLTLTVENADSATYEVSTGETGSFTDSTRINVGEGVAVGESVTVKVTGTNSRGTYEETFTYHKQDVDLDQCVFFKNSKNWVRANAYIFGEDASGETTEVLSGWSGVPMFEYAEDTDGNMIYAVEVPDIEKYNMVIFNNNVAEIQSSLGSYGQMYDASTGTWSQYLQPGAGKAKVKASLESATIVGEKEVTFTVSNADSAVYSLNGGTETPFTDSVTLKVGTNLEEGESDTVKIVATKGDKVTEKVYTYTMGENKPLLSISPASETTFTDVLDVEITAENVVECSYQINGGEAQPFTGSKTLVIGEDCEVGDSVEITVYGKSSNGKEAAQKAVYVKVKPKEHYYVFFKNTADWSNVTAHVWQKSTQNVLATWPGTAMTVYDAANKVYMLDLGTETTYDMIIFSNSGSNQTADLSLGTAGQAYDYSNGSWSDYYVAKTPTISTTLEAGTITETTQVTYTVKDALEATYKVDSSEAVAFEEEVTITVGEGLKAGETQTVVVKAINGDEMTVKVYTYEMTGGNEVTITPIVTVEPTPALTDVPTVTPIVTVEPTPVLTDVPTVTPIVTVEPTPALTDVPTVTPTPTKEPVKEKVVVHFKSSADVVTLFYQNKSDTENRNVWQEAAMVSEGNGWFSYTISSSTRAKIYCVENGVKTEEYMLEEGEWWYANDSWNAVKPDESLVTVTPIVTEVPTVTPVLTPGVTTVPTVTSEPTTVPTVTVKPTVTEVPTITTTPTITKEPTVTATPTITTAPIVTATPAPTVTNAPIISVLPTPTQKPAGEVDEPGLLLEEGQLVKDKVTKATFMVTKSDAKKGTVTYVKPKTGAKGTVTIPKSITVAETTYKVTAIADSAFKGNKKITKVTIGSNIQTIGKNAFSGCTKLKTVNMGANVKTIGDKAFYKCTSLTKITIPSKVSKIGKSAFYGCRKLKSITIKTTKLTKSKVGSKALKGIHSKATIKVPKSKLKSYKTMLKSKGVGSKVKIKK